MKDLLAPRHAAVLERLAASRTLIGFDFDGTLAPIVADRERAAMRARTARLLAALCARYPCAVISGRARADVAARLGAAPVRWVIGNHGLEPSPMLPAARRALRANRPVLRRALAGVPGIDIEDKNLSLAVHYRHAPDKRAARALIDAAIAALPVPMRVVPGKLVVNLVPAEAPHKGDALRTVRARARADAALFVGDDVTDEDVFALRDDGLVSVRVGAARRSAAPWYIRDQRAVDALLARLIALRPPGAGKHG